MSKGARDTSGNPTFLLVGPYDPQCGEYTFLAPPLGVWRLAGVLASVGVDADVFDPNCCDGPPDEALVRALLSRHWDVIGISTTGMTLRYDLELAHLARRVAQNALIIAGGMEATFKPELMFRIGPFDLVVLGEGEKPLLELADRLRKGHSTGSMGGTATRLSAGGIARSPQRALTKVELRDAIFKTPYERMPYRAYWDRLEQAYRVGGLPFKADREARLAEIRSVRLITLNYCPMGCTFCSSTNFLNAAQGSVAGIARLDPEDCMAMIKIILAAQPGIRTIIFQDDIFVFRSDHRIMPLCRSIVEAKSRGELPGDLQFISTNRIDAMDPERLAAMRRAGFRVLGFGVESFSKSVLKEFNKDRIFEHIDPILEEALKQGITPFLDLILTSPRCSLRDVAETVRKAYHWLLAGCETGMYPYVIPFSGAAMATDPSLEPYTSYTTQRIRHTDIEWRQPSKILPLDARVGEAIVAMEHKFNLWLAYLESSIAHLPSRVRSLVWVICAASVLTEAGEKVPRREDVVEQLFTRLPNLDHAAREALRQFDSVLRTEVIVNA